MDSQYADGVTHCLTNILKVHKGFDFSFIKEATGMIPNLKVPLEPLTRQVIPLILEDDT